MSAYVICSIDVQDAKLYAEYTSRAPSTIAAFGGTYVVRNGPKFALEGEVPHKRVVILEFPSSEQARSWHSSPAYAPVKEIRHKAASSTLYVIEGPETPVI